MFANLLRELGPWSWMVIGLVLLLLEMLIPGVFLLWIGIAAFVTGLLSLMLWDATFWVWQLQVVIFVVLALAATLIGKRFYGGKLGATLTQLSEMMRTGEAMPIVALGTKIPDAAVILSNKKVGCVLVVADDGALAGIITDGDLARHLHRNLKDVAVEEIMTRSPKTVPPDMSAGAAVAYLNDNNIGLLIVVENGYPVGVVHFHDLLRIGAA